MLDNNESIIAADGFAVYDHDWQYFAEFLGEPFLINNHLIYFDGRIAYLCSFVLGDPHKECQFKDLESLARIDNFKNALLLNFWGRFSDPPDLIFIGGHEYNIVQESKYYDSHEVVIPIKEFDFSLNKKARLARNAAHNKGYSSNIFKRNNLTSQHIMLIENFIAMHDISSTHLSFVLAISSLIKLEHVVLAEIWLGVDLKGFAVLSQTSKNRAVMLQGFYDKEPGNRASDAVIDLLIKHCCDNNIEYLHLGYSPSVSLLEFKRKWGAIIDGPVFREAFFTRNQYGNDLVSSGCFPWRERIIVDKFKSSNQ